MLGVLSMPGRPESPLDPGEAVHVKIRDGAVADRPIYVALAVTTEGRREILGLWAGDGGEGRQALAAHPHRDQEPRCE